jgi:hypothetical protein
LDQNPRRQPEDWNQIFQPGEFTELTLQKLYSRFDSNKTQIQSTATLLQTAEFYPISSPLSLVEIKTILTSWIETLGQTEVDMMMITQLKRIVEILDQIDDYPHLKQQCLQLLATIEQLEQERSVKVATFILFAFHQMNQWESLADPQASSPIYRSSN